ncbi:MAG: hypothetical protein HRU29_01695 [Rhizobiales bacterium]|nr:hypothetical protein [Hyphomicrobiales bacterium]NRB13088.1 hypothetical protein [Hyphomicrobiales bacterium]
MTNSNISTLHDIEEHCPACNRLNPNMELIQEEFPAGRGEDTVLSVSLHSFYCDDCGVDWLEKRAESLMHDTICNHLKRLTPSEIRKTRGKLSVAEFAGCLGFSEMSIRRWEAGSIIQDVSSDRLLRVFRNPVGQKLISQISNELEMKKFQPEEVIGWVIDISDPAYLNSERKFRF